ncbi:phage holin family protein [Gayadomonas joobiniege]|uniref:phage holin family protein n=1 Tax=Gayadomonas joobiniege TaxID=1234606 RepID=UPI00035F68AC|nr:phage holin family protein [Gayadomonas joobiniege]
MDASNKAAQPASGEDNSSFEACRTLILKIRESFRDQARDVGAIFHTELNLNIKSLWAVLILSVMVIVFATLSWLGIMSAIVWGLHQLAAPLWLSIVIFIGLNLLMLFVSARAILKLIKEIGFKETLDCFISR